MSKADGKVVIRTDLDNSSLSKGVKGIKSTLSGVKDVVKGLGSTIAAAFSVAAIVKFSKEAMSAASAQTEAETKLETIMRRRMNATDESIQSVKDYASALQEIGVIGDEVQLSGLQELATYVDNPESLKKMNEAMNDMLAQQYGLNATADNAVSIATMLGKVLDGQTSALSRYGYSFTEAQERLLKYGTEEQRVATLAEVIGESVGGMNAALAQTPDGKMKQLKNSFGDVMETAGIALKNFLVPVIDFLNILVQKLAVAANAFKAFSELITGKKADSAAAAYTGTAEAIEGVTEATEDAEKAQKRYTAGFDEITKVESNNSSSGAETPGAAGFADSISFGGLAEVESEAETFAKRVVQIFSEMFAPLKEAWDEYGGSIVRTLQNIKGRVCEFGTQIADSTVSWFSDLNWEPLMASFDNLLKAVQPFVDIIFDGLSWVYNNVLLPLGKWTIEEEIPAVLNAIGDAIGLISSVAKTVAPWLKAIWDDFLAPAAGFVGDAFVALFETVGKVLKDVAANETAVQVLSSVAKAILAIVAAIEAWTIVQAIIDALMAVSPLTWLVVAIGAVIAAIVLCITYWDDIKVAMQQVWDKIVSLFSSIGSWFKQRFADAASGVRNAFASVGSFFSGVWSGITSAFGNVSGWFKDKFSAAWQAVKDVFSKGGKVFDGIKDGILDGLKSVVNALIKGINKIVAVPFNGINSALSKLKKVNILGAKPFDWISTFNVPQIPRLAQGAVIPPNREFMAVLGDQKHGTNIEAPLDTIREAVAIEIADKGSSAETMEILQEILEAIYSIKIGDEVIGKAANRYQRKMAVMRGGAL